MDSDRTPWWAELSVRTARSGVLFYLGYRGFESQISATADRPYFLLACMFMMGALPADLGTFVLKKLVERSNGNGNGGK